MPTRTCRPPSSAALLLAACLGGAAMAAFSPLALAQQQTAAAPKVWRLPPRTLPLPPASEAFRAYLAQKPQPRVMDVLRMTPKNAAQWQRLQKMLDAQAAATARKAAEEQQADVQAARLAGVNVYFITPARIDPRHAGQLFVHIHGGAYVLNAGRASTGEGVLIATRSGIPVLSIDYRMPPQHPFPAALHDVAAVWRAVLEKYAPQQLAMGGTSAGAGLSMAALLYFRQQGLPLPAALFLGTPWADLTQTGDSFHLNEGVDDILVTWRGVLDAAGRLYANGRNRRDPLLSPIYGDLQGFPPTLLFTGTRDLFLSLTARTHRKLRDAGVDARIHVFEGLSHGEYNSPRHTPESIAAHCELSAFLKRHLQGRCAMPQSTFCGLRAAAAPMPDEDIRP